VKKSADGFCRKLETTFGDINKAWFRTAGVTVSAKTTRGRWSSDMGRELVNVQKAWWCQETASHWSASLACLSFVCGCQS